MLLELIQVALGWREALSRVLSEREWWMLYDESMRQAVANHKVWKWNEKRKIRQSWK